MRKEIIMHIFLRNLDTILLAILFILWAQGRV